MRRRLLVACVVLVAGVLLAASPAWAQEKKFEVGAGFQYDMFNSGFEVDPSFGWHARFDWYFKPRWAVGVYYESVLGSDDLPDNGGYDVDIDYYGVRGTWLLGDDPAFQMLLFASGGTGSVDYDNPEIDSSVPDSSDIQYWYEAGFGVQFAAGQRWRFRIDMSFRRFTPDEPNLLQKSGRAALVPAFEAAFRF
ncbi:MAG: porin family protein [Acidobacteria bacterium]|nr:porin family protein [Acidobacteriota bacterium]